MDKKLKRVIAILGVVGLAVSGPVGYAAASSGENEKGFEKGKQEEFLKDLNLTPEQKEKVKAKHEVQKALHKQSREQMKAKMEALHEELGKPVTDRAVVNGLVADINTLKGQGFAERIEGVLALKEILTPEQFAKFQAKHKEHGFCKRGDWKKHQKGGSQENGPEGTEQGPDKS